MGETSIANRHVRSRTIAPLSEIAMALKALVSHKEWTDDDVISVLEELTGTSVPILKKNESSLDVRTSHYFKLPVATS